LCSFATTASKQALAQHNSLPSTATSSPAHFTQDPPPSALAVYYLFQNMAAATLVTAALVGAAMTAVTVVVAEGLGKAVAGRSESHLLFRPYPPPPFCYLARPVLNPNRHHLG
jgi:hypothetical protein